MDGEMTPETVMVWLGVNISGLIRLILYHHLPHYVVDDRVMFNRRDIERWAEHHRSLMAKGIVLNPPDDPKPAKK